MDEIMTTKEVADYLRIHPSSVYKRLKEGKLPAFRIGTDWRFKRSSIELWMKEMEENE